LIHISDMSAERRINHPRDIMKVGQSVKAQVLEVDSEKRRLKLGIKQMLPSSIEEYIHEHQEGNMVSGRVVEVSGEHARVELGEGIQGTCRIVMEGPAKEEIRAESKVDLSALSSRLKAHWKEGSSGGGSKPEEVRAGQIRSFRIAKLDRAAKKIELEFS
jgi:small subunit ribosomal protein S1